MSVFITGDRSGGNPLSAGFVALELLRAAGAGETVQTGDNDGVEALVRRIAQDTGFPVEVVDSPRFIEGELQGHVDWDARHRRLRDDDVKVVVIHEDVLASRVGRSVLGILPESSVRVVSSFDLLATSEG